MTSPNIFKSTTNLTDKSNPHIFKLTPNLTDKFPHFQICLQLDREIPIYLNPPPTQLTNSGIYPQLNWQLNELNYIWTQPLTWQINSIFSNPPPTGPKNYHILKFNSNLTDKSLTFSKTMSTWQTNSHTLGCLNKF